jgi:NAD(P)-dependent dehydrogenase (short-subunit alcohol dehydrogenase family)
MSDKKIVLITGAGSGIGRAIAHVLAKAGHCVYAGLREPGTRNQARAAELEAFARDGSLRLRVVDLDVLSEASCRAAVDRVLLEQGRVDVVVNNAGMLMVGVTEAFSPEQVAEIFDTNAISWLRVNRAALPAMRRQRAGLLVYVGSTTSRIHEPFIGPYVASKVAGEALAEVMGMEANSFGIETVIVQPGAFTQGTEHFHHARPPAHQAVVEQYGVMLHLAEGLGQKLEAIDAANGGSLDVSAVGEAVRDVLAQASGERPRRIVVDAQRKGLEELNQLHDAKQQAFLDKMGLGALTKVAR